MTARTSAATSAVAMPSGVTTHAATTPGPKAKNAPLGSG